MFVPSPSESHLLLERYLERQALEVYRPATFRGVVTAYGIAPTMPVHSPKGVTFTLRASEIFGARMKMLPVQDLGPEICGLSLRGAALMAAYQHWLTTAYTKRYQYLATDLQREWLSQVVSLVVVRYLMEEKYARLLTGERPTFADPWVGYVMGHLHLDHRMFADLAHVVHRLVENPEQAHSIITLFLNECKIQMQRHPFVQPEPLLPLPEGISLPFVLPPLLKGHQRLNQQEKHDEGQGSRKGDV